MDDFFPPVSFLHQCNRIFLHHLICWTLWQLRTQCWKKAPRCKLHNCFRAHQNTVFSISDIAMQKVTEIRFSNISSYELFFDFSKNSDQIIKVKNQGHGAKWDGYFGLLCCILTRFSYNKLKIFAFNNILQSVWRCMSHAVINTRVAFFHKYLNGHSENLGNHKLKNFQAFLSNDPILNSMLLKTGSRLTLGHELNSITR